MQLKLHQKLFILSLLFALQTTGVQGQSLKHQGASLEELVPQGWSHYETTGDMNKDGIVDVAVMSKPNFKEKIVTRDDGYEYNFNQPVFAIYFGTSDGQLKLWKEYGNLLPADENTATGEPAAEDAVPDVPTDEDAGSAPYEDLAVPPANNSAQDGEAA